MKLFSNLSDVDKKAVSQAGIPAAALMEAAGEQVAQAVRLHCAAGKRGVIVCGPGNNGGDGFVCARKLYEAGYHALTVIYTGRHYRNEALANLEKLMISLPVPLVNAQAQLELAVQHISEADFMVDALFGSGLARPIVGLEARLIEAMNARCQGYAAWVLAVDLPSGIGSATGQVLGCAVQADATVTLAAFKPGLFLPPGKAHAGTLSLADIGIPQQLLREEESPFRLISADDAQAWLPPRRADSYKYSYGNVLVIAGSADMPGAAVLCSEAAMTGGAGLVTLAAPSGVFRQLPLMPEIMRLSLPDEAHLGDDSVPVLKDALTAKKFTTVLIGPGLGRKEQTQSAILSLLTHFKTLGIPVVVDADALYALSQHPMVLSEYFTLTPHVGECGKLLAMENTAVSADLLQAAAQAREKYGAQVILKSASTVIATIEAGSVGVDEPPALDSGGFVWISPTGNPGMATAGSGDVLGGIVAAMAAQVHALNLPEIEWQAAPLGVYLHGLAGDAAAKSLTPYAMRASSITEHLPQAFQQVMIS